MIITDMRLKILLFAFGLLLAGACRAEEGLLLDLPHHEGWKVGNRQYDKGVQFIELVKNGETVENWTELVTMISKPIDPLINLEVVMENFLTETQKSAPKAKLTLVEKDLKNRYPRIMFKIEAADYPGKSGQEAESDLFYLVKGVSHLFINVRAVKRPHLSKAQVDSWAATFRAAKVMDNPPKP